MQSPRPDVPEEPPREQPGAGCSGCPGCKEEPSPEVAEPAVPGRFRSVLMPIGLFLFPIVLAIVGAVLGGITVIGELLGGLLGLAAGMAASALVARAIGLAGPEGQEADSHD